MTFTNQLGPVDTTSTPSCRWHTLPFAAVQITDGFWAKFQKLNREVSLQHGYRMLEQAGNFRNLRIAAGRESGTYTGRNFYDEDVYKWLEALAWELARQEDTELQRMADEVIELIAAAQRPDGYLDSYYQVVQPDQKWADLDHGHELYCAGHLIQAAVAFQRALSDSRLLAVAVKLVDHIDSIFGPDKRHGTCGHPEIETALVELYRTTGKSRDLTLAKFFVDQRGQRRMRGLGAYGPEYHQDHMPVREAQAMAGHAVRQLYLATGVTDLYMETGEAALLEAMNRLWADMVHTKLYVTGGVGSRFDGESFGDPYELPSDQCYCETCAAIGSLMWNWRMLLITGDSRYADIMERTLYNGILCSPGLDGQSYFYVNPLLVRDGRYVRASANPPEGLEFIGRPAWHEVACCPPNVMRLLSSLSHYLATADRTGLQVHHYASGNIRADHLHEAVVEIKTEYPWDGLINLVIRQTDGAPWTLRLRIPAWCTTYAVTINDQSPAHLEVKSGYLVLTEAWHAGDEIALALTMQPQCIAPNPRVDALRGSLAIQRGPLVYCLESHDQPAGAQLLDMEIDPSEPLAARWDDVKLNGIVSITACGKAVNMRTWEEALYRPLIKVDTLESHPVTLTAIPYFAWGNRGLAGMRVWMPRA